MRKLLVLMGVSLLGTGIPGAQENGGCEPLPDLPQHDREGGPGQSGQREEG